MRKDISKIDYAAWLTQRGENKPEADVVIEKIYKVSWERSAPGTYHFKKETNFSFYSNGLPSHSVTDILPNGDKITIELTNGNEITLKTFAGDDLNTPVDGILNDYYFEFIIPKPLFN